MRLEENKLNKTGLFIVMLDQPENIPVIDGEKEIIIYRMVQEILNNTIKHSQAKRISITVSYNKSIFELTINDDGVRFDVAKKMANARRYGQWSYQPAKQSQRNKSILYHHHPIVKVLLVSMVESEEGIIKMLKLWVKGYLSKHVEPGKRQGNRSSIN